MIVEFITPNDAVTGLQDMVSSTLLGT